MRVEVESIEHQAEAAACAAAGNGGDAGWLGTLLLSAGLGDWFGTGAGAEEADTAAGDGDDFDSSVWAVINKWVSFATAVLAVDKQRLFYRIVLVGGWKWNYHARELERV